jgi:uncharacterized LabA/DUF88 family protein
MIKNAIYIDGQNTYFGRFGFLKLYFRERITELHISLVLWYSPRGERNNFAFIDSQNLNRSILREGWKLDFGKFRVFLQRKYQIQKAFLFIGYIPGNVLLYERLRSMGYVVIFKPTLQNRDGMQVKGNCDAELVLHSMITFNDFDKAMIVSGDGDFYCLIDYLKKQEKLLNVGIPNRSRYSALLKKFRPDFFFVSDLEHKLSQQK